MHYRKWSVAATALALLLGASGCGKGPTNVEGIVTLDGEPLAGATVAFNPIGGKGQPATAITESDGSFRLQTAKGDYGALPGEYKVTVTKGEELQFKGGEQPSPEEVSKMMRAKTRKEKTVLAKKSPVPSKYASAETTPFKETVPPKGKITLELKSR